MSSTMLDSVDLHTVCCSGLPALRTTAHGVPPAHLLLPPSAPPSAPNPDPLPTSLSRSPPSLSILPIMRKTRASTSMPCHRSSPSSPMPAPDRSVPLNTAKLWLPISGSVRGIPATWGPATQLLRLGHTLYATPSAGGRERRVSISVLDRPNRYGSPPLRRTMVLGRRRRSSPSPSPSPQLSWPRAYLSRSASISSWVALRKPAPPAPPSFPVPPPAAPLAHPPHHAGGTDDPADLAWGQGEGVVQDHVRSGQDREGWQGEGFHQGRRQPRAHQVHRRRRGTVVGIGSVVGRGQSGKEGGDVGAEVAPLLPRTCAAVTAAVGEGGEERPPPAGGAGDPEPIGVGEAEGGGEDEDEDADEDADEEGEGTRRGGHGSLDGSRTSPDRSK